MSVLTKVFVVLLTVVAIALSMLVVGAFARQDDWRASASHWQQAALDAQAKERTVSADAAIKQARWLDRHGSDLATISELEATNARKDRDLAEAKRKLAERESSLAIEQGNVTALANQNKVFVADVNKEREFSAKLSRRNSELERQNIDLNDRVKELTANITMARSQVRALQQQLAAVSGGEATGQPAIASTSPMDGTANIVEEHLPQVLLSPYTDAPAPIRGEITSIQDSLASISVGSADGVSPGMEFLIYRPSTRHGRPQYLGTLRVMRVEAHESAGLIEHAEGDIRPGDAAKDAASLAMRG